MNKKQILFVALALLGSEALVAQTEQAENTLPGQGKGMSG